MKGDFLGFSFNGVHSDDMGIVRMSDGSRYSTDLTPEIEDRTNSVPGRDGVYFYGSDFKDGKISVKVAFDQLTDRQFRALRKWLGVKEPAPLIFDEFPFKKYMAKLASAPVFDYVCFDERRRWPSETAQDGVRVVDRTTVTEDVPYTEDLTVENGSSVVISRKPETVTVIYESEQLTAEDFDYVSETGELSIHITDVESGDAINITVDYTIEESRTEIEREQVYPYEYADDVERIYKGEGTIDFEVPFPYAIGAGVTVEDIREDASVPEQWEGASYLPTAAEYVEYGINQYDDGVIPVYNCGDVPTGFKLTLESGSSSGTCDITYKNKSLNIDFSIMPFEENDDSAVVVDTFNRVIRGVDSGVLYNKCIVGGDFFLLDPSTDIGDTDEQISLALENSQFSSITYDYLFY